MRLPELIDGKWRLDFTGWTELSRRQQVELLIAIGDCDGEWWGGGRAEFSRLEDAVKAVGWAARLRVDPPELSAGATTGAAN